MTLTVTALPATFIPRGLVFLWSGSIGTIPTGYVLCNGSNGTPDLRDRFIIAAGLSYNVGDMGGNNQHSHGYSGTTDVSQDILAGGTAIVDTMGAGQFENLLNGHFHSITGQQTDTSDNIPAYYALAYVMKT